MMLPNIIVFDTRFNKAFETLLNLQLPATIALKLVKSYKEISDHSKDVFNVRDSFLKRLCKQEEDGSIAYKDEKPIFISDEAAAEFNNEMTSILTEKFEITLDSKITLPENCEITPNDIIALEPIINIG